MRGGDEEARRLLEAIAAVPRAAGTAEEQLARDRCATYLREHGFAVQEENFSYSAFAGTLATPLAGALLFSMFLFTALLAPSGRLSALLMLMVHVAGLAAVLALSSGSAILRLRWRRRTSVNLVGRLTAATEDPALWLVAHLDSKSQPVSILVRAIGVGVCVAVAIATAGLFIVQSAFGIPVAATVWWVVCAPGIAASIPLLLSYVTNRSRGALDNASGVVAILLAAAALAREGVSAVGVLITSAEELGLAGAHAWSEKRVPGRAINCDSVDDSGIFLSLAAASRGGEDIVRTELRLAAAAAETPFRERRRLVGILVDSMALEARGWDTVTLSRGTLGSLRRIHTAADAPGGCRGVGAAAAAILIRDASSAILARV